MNLHFINRELKTEIDACQRLVDALKDELSAQRVGFATYKASAEAQLSELQNQKATVGREVLALRRKLSLAGKGAGNGAKTAAAPRREKKTEAPKPNQDTKDCSAAPDGVGSEIEDDEKIVAARVLISVKSKKAEEIKISRSIVEEYVGVIKMEEQTSDARPTMSGSTSMALTAIPTPERHVPPARKSILRKKALGPGAARDRALQKDHVMRQRMILLRHAFQCTAPEGTCKASWHCAAIKALWDHILKDGCKDPNCGVRHCVSSRYVLRNYRRWCALPLSRGAVCHAVKTSNSIRWAEEIHR